MKKKPQRLTISFSKEYEDVFHFLDNQKNSSRFICELVLKEIKSGKRDNFEEQVYKSLMKIIEKENLTLGLKAVPQPSFHIKTSLQDDEIDLMNELFG